MIYYYFSVISVYVLLTG